MKFFLVLCIEQEADEAVERLRREQEIKRKQNAMTLEEIREQVSILYDSICIHIYWSRVSVASLVISEPIKVKIRA